MKLKLQSLTIICTSDTLTDEQQKSSATAIINQLLHSSKDAIQTLEIEALGWLPGLIIPKLKNLQKLVLSENWYSTRSSAMFPSLCEMADVFPNLKELEMRIPCDDVYFPSSQPLKPMQSVQILRIVGYSTPENKGKLMKATPNVKTLFMVDFSVDSYNTFSWMYFWMHDTNSIDGFHVVCENLPKLEKLGWVISELSHNDDLLIELDPIITGIPGMFCKKMAAKFRNKNFLRADKLAAYQLRRQNSSILDLKELKTLDIDFFMMEEEKDSDYDESERDAAWFDAESPLFETGFTKVSKFLAFDLMPNLKIRTRIHK